MIKRLASLVMILTLGGSVLAGIPMPSSESGMMDCCKKALEHNHSPHVAAARLCCAMNCNEPSSTSSNTSQSFSQTSCEPMPSVVAALPTIQTSRQLGTQFTSNTLSRTYPVYILNLALLI